MGETMNRASRLESTGVPSTVHVDSATLAAAQLTPSSPGVQEREVELKGLGAEKTYLVDPSTVIPVRDPTLGVADAGDRDTSPDVHCTATAVKPLSVATK